MSRPAQIGSLLEGAVQDSPQRPALAYDGTVLSFRELGAAVDRLAARLGERPGEPVAVLGANVPSLVVALFAVWRAGAVAVPLSSRLRSFELGRVFADAKPTAAVVLSSRGDAASQRNVEELRAGGALSSCLLVDHGGEVTGELTGPRSGAAPRLSPEIAAIMYTSGTTGDPKGALMSHALGEAEGHQLPQRLGPSARAACVLVPPASHAFGLACLLCALAARATTVFVDSTTSMTALSRALRRHTPEVLHGTPALFARLLKVSEALPIRTGFTAGSMCAPELLQGLDRRGMRILNIYGMTEFGCATACRFDDPPEVRHTTVGGPLPGYELRVLPGERDHDGGPVQVRGPYVTVGYQGRPFAAEEATADGWFDTGDLGVLDDAGHLSVRGRSTEVVHVGGFNVFPGEVESFLLTHPDIAHAAVIGIAHPVMGETVKALLVPRAGAELDPSEVVRFARANIAGYKIPYAIEIVGELPLLASGKPDRRALADRFAAREAVT